MLKNPLLGVCSLDRGCCRHCYKIFSARLRTYSSSRGSAWLHTKKRLYMPTFCRVSTKTPIHTMAVTDTITAPPAGPKDSATRRMEGKKT